MNISEKQSLFGGDTMKATASNELLTVRSLTERIESAKEKLNELQDALQRLTAELNGLPKTPNRESRLEKLITLKVDAEKEIERLQNELLDEKAALTTKLFTADLTLDERKVLLRRYVDNQSFDVISSKLHLSQSRVFALHRIACRKFSGR